MAHFAKLDENNIVLEVNVVSNDVLDSSREEESGIEFLTEWSGGYTNWKQTSYNGNIRKNYAGIGYTYDAGRDAFIAPQPWASWILNETTCQWEPPVAYPTVDPENPKLYDWFEPNQQWIEVTSPQA